MASGEDYGALCDCNFLSLNDKRSVQQKGQGQPLPRGFASLSSLYDASETFKEAILKQKRNLK